MNKEIGIFLQLHSLGISDKEMPQGNLNRNLIVIDSYGRKLILRRENPHGRQEETPFIRAEYEGVGFLKNPNNGFRFRTSEEQHKFADFLGENDVKASKTIFSDPETQLIIYEDGAVSLDQLWITMDPRAPDTTNMALQSLAESHRKGIVLGDRWGPNELLTADNKIIFVDFDIEIFGPETKEFEMASMFYFLSFFAQKSGSLSNLNQLGAVYKKALESHLFKAIYKEPLLLKYIINYFSYFSCEGKYGWDNQNRAEEFLKSFT